MRESDDDESTLYCKNAVLDLLHWKSVEAGAAAEALQSLYHAITAFASPEFGSGVLPVEVAQERLASAAHDAAQIVAALGEPGIDLEFHVVLRDRQARLRDAAVHEAGHAVAATLLLDAGVKFASVASEDTATEQMDGVTVLSPPYSFIMGYTKRPQEPLRRALEATARRLAVVALAGAYAVAESATDRFPSFGTDLAQARRLCAFFSASGREEDMWRESHRAASLVVKAPKDCIEGVARSLLERQRLAGADIDAIVAAHCDRRIEDLRDELFPER